MTDVLPTLADVIDADARLRGHVIETPVLESELINRALGGRVMFKAECLQHSGSFKIRGALNRLLKLGAAERMGGVVAFSSGNHAQAVALAAHWLGVSACIVMPRDAPRVKIEGTRFWGAEVVLYDRYRESREAIGARLASERGATLVPPFDHPDVVAGQGTAGLELARTLKDRGQTLEALFVPCSGGGLVAGCALAVKSVFPACEVYAVEPVGHDDLAQSLLANERRTNTSSEPSLCDGLLAPTPGAITFPINRRLLRGAVTVDDTAVRRAMGVAARHLKVVVEPSGAAGLAAAFTHAKARGTVGVILSGGNVDDSLFAEVLAAAPAALPS